MNLDRPLGFTEVAPSGSVVATDTLASLHFQPDARGRVFLVAPGEWRVPMDWFDGPDGETVCSIRFEDVEHFVAVSGRVREPGGGPLRASSGARRQATGVEGCNSEPVEVQPDGYFSIMVAPDVCDVRAVRVSGLTMAYGPPLTLRNGSPAAGQEITLYAPEFPTYDAALSDPRVWLADLVHDLLHAFDSIEPVDTAHAELIQQELEPMVRELEDVLEQIDTPP